jgi:hypothetical protein
LVLRIPFCSLTCSGLSSKVFPETLGINPITGSKCHPLVPLPSPSEFSTSAYPAQGAVYGGQTARLVLLSASPGVFIPTAFHGNGSPYNPGLPRPALSALRVSLPSQRFSSPQSSRVFFTPERSWDSPFRAFPSGRAVASSRRPLPSCRYRLAPPAVERRYVTSCAQDNDQATRLQGLAPFRSPFSRAWGLASAWGRCSPGLLPLQGLLILCDAAPLRDRSSPVVTSLNLPVPGFLKYPLSNTHVPNMKYPLLPGPGSPRKAHSRVSIHRECSSSLSRCLPS